MSCNRKKILIIQTAFLGDVILATVLIEALHVKFPDAAIDFLVRKNHEGVLAGHPYLGQVLTWNKSTNKWRNFWNLVKIIRAEKYDCVINVQRHFSTALLSLLARSKIICGYRASKLSAFFTHTAPHSLTENRHEITRCLNLLLPLWDPTDPPLLQFKPKIYPEKFTDDLGFKRPYITITPTSARATKKLPFEKWAELIDRIPAELDIFICGSPAEDSECQKLLLLTKNPAAKVLTQGYSLLQTAAIMQDSLLNYVLDSAANHICSSLNAPVCTVYCSTSDEFGFGSLSTDQTTVEVKELPCRPCTSHGRTKCPLSHYKCGTEISVAALEDVLIKALKARLKTDNALGNVLS